MTDAVPTTLPLRTAAPSAAPRIELALVRRSDAADLVHANQASTAVHRPWIRPFTDEAGFVAWFQGSLTGAHVHFVARERAAGAPVAVISLENVVTGAFWNAHLSYYGMAGYVGGGWQGEAVRAALERAFGEVGLHRLEAAVQPANHRSRRLLERLGFRQEGVSAEYLFVNGAWRDHERWAVLRREFVR